MTLIIDPQNSGISGNMIAGALIDFGVDYEILKDIMEHYGSYFGDIKVKITKIQKSGISASFVDVKCKDKQPLKFMKLIEILNNIEHPEITAEILNFSKKVFKTLADAEAHVHGTTIDKVHFHEVGAADAVADIVGSSYLFHKLGLHKNKVYGMPVALGGGRINSMHGKLSVPAPATLEILKNAPTFGGPVNKELATPTGAALYVNMVDEFTNFYPLLTNKETYYGAGKMDLPFPNVLRIVNGTSGLEQENVTILETNMDDVTGEVLGNIFNGLMAHGARDISIIPTITKKNRPGHLLRVIARPEDTEILSEKMIRETGTLGVRVIPYAHRNIAHREIITSEVEMGGINFEIDMKVGKIGDDVISVKPEYEDARKISETTGIPLKDVMDAATQIFRMKSEIFKN
jgi:pyridinium-3,5-bisthiocarboxylic acid mononucleotide nickel chelatase